MKNQTYCFVDLLLAALKGRYIYDRKNHTAEKKFQVKHWKIVHTRKSKKIVSLLKNIVKKLKSTAMSIKNKMHPNVSYDKKLFLVIWVFSNIQFIKDMVQESSLKESIKFCV